jgi:hypothetical protein
MVFRTEDHMANDKNPGQRNMEEEETGEIDRREESQRRREQEDAERRAGQGSHPGGKDARPWSDRDSGRGSGGSPRGPSSGKRY